MTSKDDSKSGMEVQLHETPLRDLKSDEIVIREKLLSEFSKRRDHLLKEMTMLCAEQRQTSSKNIFATIRMGSLVELQEKLESGAYTVEERDYNGATPLHIAAHEGRTDVVSLLLSFMADPFALDNNQLSAADLAIRRNYPGIARQIMSAAKFRQPDSDCSDSATADTAAPASVYRDRAPSSASAGGVDEGSAFAQSGEALSSMEHETTQSTTSEEVAVPSKFCSIPDDRKFVVAMVGLPGRGKSFISKRISRYLNWKGVPCRVFNAGDYRRHLLGIARTREADFFDPANAESVALREKMCEMAVCDMTSFLQGLPGAAVGILDATNTTKERRKKVGDFFAAHPKIQVVFVESICNDDTMIRENILRDKLTNEDWKEIVQHQGSDVVVRNFLDRVDQYRKKYDTLEVSENFPFVKIMNVTQSYIVHRFLGPIATRVTCFLLNQHPIAYPVMITMPGETVWQRDRTFGGNNSLTETGHEYAMRLRSYIQERMGESQRLTILASHDNACEETLRYLLGERPRAETLESSGSSMARNTDVIRLTSLDGMRFGSFLGLTVAEACAKWPKSFVKLFGAAAFKHAFLAAKLPIEGLGVSPAVAQCMQMSTSPNSPHKLGVSPSQPAFHAPLPRLPVPPIILEAYGMAFPRGESIRMVNLRLEGAIFRLLEQGNAVLVLAPSHSCQGILSFLTDKLPELSCTVDIPRNSVVEINPTGAVAYKNLLPSLLVET